MAEILKLISPSPTDMAWQKLGAMLTHREIAEHMKNNVDPIDLLQAIANVHHSVIGNIVPFERQDTGTHWSDWE